MWWRVNMGILGEMGWWSQDGKYGSRAVSCILRESRAWNSKLVALPGLSGTCHFIRPGQLVGLSLEWCAERRDKNGWAGTERSYSSSFTEVPEPKADSRQGWIPDPGEGCPRGPVQPVPATPSMAPLEPLQCAPRLGGVLGALGLALFTHAYKQDEDDF